MPNINPQPTLHCSTTQPTSRQRMDIAIQAPPTNSLCVPPRGKQHTRRPGPLPSPSCRPSCHRRMASYTVSWPASLPLPTSTSHAATRSPLRTSTVPSPPGVPPHATSAYHRWSRASVLRQHSTGSSHPARQQAWNAFCSQVAPHASSHSCRHFHVPPDVGTARPCPPSTPAPPHPSTSLHVVASAASSRCRLECVQGSRSPAPGRPDPDGRGLNLVGDTISGSAASPSLHGSTPPHRSLLPLSSSPPVASSLRRRLQSSVILDLVTVVGSDPATLGRKKVPPSLSLEPRGLQRLARAEGACPMSDARPYN